MAPTISSHPMWVRGLKHAVTLQPVTTGYVAPYVGAWIETFLEGSHGPV